MLVTPVDLAFVAAGLAIVVWALRRRWTPPPAQRPYDDRQPDRDEGEIDRRDEHGVARYLVASATISSSILSIISPAILRFSLPYAANAGAAR